MFQGNFIAPANLVHYGLALTGGAVTALAYLWLLRLSVSKILEGRTAFPLAGYFLRLGLCAGVFILAAWGGRLDRLVMCVTGFMLVRVWFLRRKKAGSG